MKRSRPRKKGKKRSSWYVNKLDALAREKIVVERDQNTCVRCGKSAPEYKIDWSHVYSRENRAIRWHPSNSKALCFHCHKWYGENPLDSAQWFQQKYPYRYAQLQELKHKAAPPIEIQYEEVLRELGND